MTVIADSHYRLHPGHAMPGLQSSDLFSTPDHRGEPGVTSVDLIVLF